ncbi:hypothetical protein GCM10028793_09970 [Nocardiopsis oceani]
MMAVTEEIHEKRVETDVTYRIVDMRLIMRPPGRCLPRVPFAFRPEPGGRAELCGWTTGG